MEKTRDTALSDDNKSQTSPAEAVRQADEVTVTSNIEDRFANWGSD